MRKANTSWTKHTIRARSGSSESRRHWRGQSRPERHLSCPAVFQRDPRSGVVLVPNGGRPGRTRSDASAFLSPGVCWAYNFSTGLQIVPKIGLPIGVRTSRGQHAVIACLSFEHPLDALR